MTMRGELIEAAARAVEAWEVAGAPEDAGQPDDLDIHPHSYSAARVALDALLERMKEPSQELVDAMASCGPRETARSDAENRWLAALATLSPPPALT